MRRRGNARCDARAVISRDASSRPEFHAQTEKYVIANSEAPGLPLGVSEDARFRFGNDQINARRALNGVPMRAILDCGSALNGEKAAKSDELRSARLGSTRRRGRCRIFGPRVPRISTAQIFAYISVAAAPESRQITCDLYRSMRR